jgi:hypothetical protein
MDRGVKIIRIQFDYATIGRKSNATESSFYHIIGVEWCEGQQLAGLSRFGRILQGGCNYPFYFKSLYIHLPSKKMKKKVT